ncbi:MAG: tetratricopeptide repeat protein [Gemmatimonadaceae bacterium]
MIGDARVGGRAAAGGGHAGALPHRWVRAPEQRSRASGDRRLSAERDPLPRSANAHDSLGEAYERAAQRDASIAAYRKALELNPGMFSSREGLRRLGATP